MRPKMVVPTAAAAEDARKDLGALLAENRTGAELDIIASEGRWFVDVLHESSRDAEVVFVGMAEPNDHYVSYYEQLRKRTGDLPLTVYVLSAEKIAFEGVLL